MNLQAPYSVRVKKIGNKQILPFYFYFSQMVVVNTQNRAFETRTTKAHFLAAEKNKKPFLKFVLVSKIFCCSWTVDSYSRDSCWSRAPFPRVEVLASLCLLLKKMKLFYSPSKQMLYAGHKTLKLSVKLEIIFLPFPGYLLQLFGLVQ